MALRCRRLRSAHRLKHLEPLELRMVQIQRLVVPCSAMRCPERIGPRPCFKGGTLLPHRVGSVERVILSLRAFEKVKLHKPWHLVEVAVARKPDLLEGFFGPFCNSETVHRDKYCVFSSNDGCDKNIAQITADYRASGTELTLNYCRWAQKRRDDD